MHDKLYFVLTGTVGVYFFAGCLRQLLYDALALIQARFRGSNKLSGRPLLLDNGSLLVIARRRA